MSTTLADHLRTLSDRALGALLRQRPDLVVPVPADMSALAARAAARLSVARALDGLDEFTLLVLDAARLARDPAEPTTSVSDILDLTGGGAVREAAATALARLRELALAYGPDHALRLAGGVEEVSPAYPAGLGRPAADLDPAAAALCADPAALRRAVLAAPPSARAVLDRLAAGPPVGTVTAGDGALSAGPGPAAGRADHGDPVAWLVERRLLVPVARLGNAPAAVAPAPSAAGARYAAVELPREVGLLLRRDSGPLGAIRPLPPIPESAGKDPRTVDSAGAGQALEVVRRTAALLAALLPEPTPLLRAGGLGVRELRRAARAAGVDEATAALLLECAHAALLVGEAEAPGAPRADRGFRRPAVAMALLPTPGYDVWRAAPLARRWELLATAWLGMTRQPALVGRRGDGEKSINVLSAEAERTGAPAVRRAVLGALGTLPVGAAPTVGQVLDLLDWQQPRRTRGREPALREALAEAAHLGFTGLGALTSYARALLDTAPDGAEPAGTEPDADPLGLQSRPGAAPTGSAASQALDALLPPPVDHVLIQADLTVVVPGPPEPALAAELEVVAEHESAGGATVYRVTADSVRRALDAGYGAQELHDLFRHRSRTPVPQGLTYLVDDTARRHGGLRLGAAGTYLRSDDEALLVQVLTDRRLTLLGLRQLAPTVLITPYQNARLLAALRDAGYAPVSEDAGGAALLHRPTAPRAPARGSVLNRPVEPAPGSTTLSGPRLLGIVEQIRRGDAAARITRRATATIRAASDGTGPTPGQAHPHALAVLQQAIRDKTQVWVGYVDAHGATVSRLVRPTSMSAGYLRAEDERTDMLHTFALHRITAAVLDG